MGPISRVIWTLTVMLQLIELLTARLSDEGLALARSQRSHLYDDPNQILTPWSFWCKPHIFSQGWA